MEKLNKYTNTEHVLKTNELVEKVNALEKSGGKIQVVKVNDTPLEIKPEDKSVNIDLSTYAEDKDIFLYVGDSNSIPQEKLKENMIIVDPEERVVGQGIEVDAALSSTSINPIQNKAVKTEIDKINTNIEELKINGGKIQSVKVNNKTLEVAQDKSVNIDLSGYAPKTHKHNYNEITGAPTSLPANGGNSNTVNGHTVESNVPANAKFTDTVYSHPANHPASMITGLANVAKSGSYTDLTNKPTALSSFTNDTNFIASSGSITGNAATATLADKAAKDAKGNIIDATYAKDSDIYLYVGKNPVVSELNENTIVIDPDVDNNFSNVGNPVVEITQSNGNLTVTKSDGSSNSISLPSIDTSEYANLLTGNTFNGTNIFDGAIINNGALFIRDINQQNIPIFTVTKNKDGINLYRNTEIHAPLNLEKIVTQSYSSIRLTGGMERASTCIAELTISNTGTVPSVIINPSDIWETLSERPEHQNKARVYVLLISGSGSPIIEWIGCTLLCEAPAKIANKATVVTFLELAGRIYMVSAMEEG